jgi:hypothetical protein
MSLAGAVAEYHDLLTESLAVESQGQLDDQLRRRGLFFGERAICTVLRPRFLTADQLRYIQRGMNALLRAFDRALEAAVVDAGFRRQFALTEWEEQLVQQDPGFNPSPTSRVDTFFVPETGRVQVTEYNAETPAAIAYNDALTEVFDTLPITREFLRRYELRPLPGRHNLMHALLDAYHAWLGRRERPRICILDWREVPTYSEFVLFDDYFKTAGLDSFIGDPRAAEYRGGRLYVDGRAVDLIYKRVLISELVTQGGIDHPVVRAVRDRAVCMVNPFRCKILHKKSSLAVLSDERNTHLFGAEERKAIDAYVPWTRRVEERKTRRGAETVDLIPHIVAQRERLVLKPDDEYGGKGVVLGWTVDASEWERAVRDAMGTPTVVQERAEIPTEPYPSVIDGRLHVIDRMLDTNPYCYYGAYMDGCMTRLSTAALLNVTAGGGSTLPTYLIEKR